MLNLGMTPRVVLHSFVALRPVDVVMHNAMNSKKGKNLRLKLT
jgi:hypothetical protein